MMNLTPAVKQLLILNVIFFLGANTIAPMAYDFLALQPVQSDKFHIWQLLTHMFMHAKLPVFTHILFNMLALVMFGSTLEQMWGGKKFVFFYLSCGLGAALLHIGVSLYEFRSLVDPGGVFNLSWSEMNMIANADFAKNGMYHSSELFNQIGHIYSTPERAPYINETVLKSIFDGAIQSKIPTVGASGAVYGLLVAFAFLFPNAELMMMFIPIPIKAKYFVPGMLLIDLFMGLNGNGIFGASSGIAHFAHIGGALTGYIIMRYWKNNSFNSHRWN